MILITAADARRLGIGGLGAKKRRKFNNHPCEVDGYHFDSEIEAAEYGDLRIRQLAGEISDLQIHPRFVVCDADEHGREIVYEADFAYVENGDHIAEDVKAANGATITDLFRLKLRLCQKLYPGIVWKVVRR
jgi:hypothetical protein